VPGAFSNTVYMPSHAVFITEPQIKAIFGFDESRHAISICEFPKPFSAKHTNKAIG
jgi:hypothetical protein